jgi:hypothetical protein
LYLIFVCGFSCTPVQKKYNLQKDHSETTNLAQSDPAKVRELEASHAQWESGLAAPIWKSWRIGKVK